MGECRFPDKLTSSQVIDLFYVFHFLFSALFLGTAIAHYSHDDVLLEPWLILKEKDVC